MNSMNRLDSHPLFLLGMPRSGTTWLSQIFEAHSQACLRFSPNYSYPLKNTIDENSTTAQWLAHLKAARLSDDEFMTHAYRRETGELPTWDKQPSQFRLLCIKDTRFHESYLAALNRLPNAKIIYLVRDPRAMIASWVNCKEFPHGESLEDSWLHGGTRKQDGPGEYWGVADWCNLTGRYQGLATRSPERVMVVRYETLVVNARSVSSSMLNFAGLNMDPQVVRFLETAANQSSHSPYSVYRGRRATSPTADHLPESIADRIVSRVKQFGLDQFLATGIGKPL
jgi:hypothetical protein